MKPSALVIIVSLLLITLSTSAQQLAPAIEWQKSLGGTLDDVANGIIRTPDGGFLVVGATKSSNGDVSGHYGSSATNDAWVVKLSASGTIQWQRHYGGTQDDEFLNVIPAADGGYICHGITASNDGDVTGQHGGNDLWIVKLDNQGNIVWQHAYGGSSDEPKKFFNGTYGNIRFIHGHYYVIGTTTSNNGNVSGYHGGTGDIWVLKLDLQGTIVWQKCFGGTLGDYGYDIMGAENGSLILAAEVTSNDGDFGGGAGNPPRGYVIKVDANNVMVWKSAVFQRENVVALSRQDNRFFFGTSQLSCYPANPTEGIRMQYGTYTPGATTAVSPSFIGGFSPCQSSGANPTFGYNISSGNSMISLNANDLLLAASTNDTVGNDHGQWDGFLAGFRVGAGLTWRKQIGGSANDYVRGMAVIDETQFVVAGSTYSNNGDVTGNHGGSDVWIVKMGKVNKIRGTVFLDHNLNGIKDTNEPFLNNVLVESQKGSAKVASLTTGNIFSNNVDTGTYTTKVITPYAYYTPVPASKTTVFTTYNNIDSFSLALQPVPGNRDYKVSLFATSYGRPGFKATYQLGYTNVGTDTLMSKQVKLVKDSRQSFVSASVTPASIVGDTLIWNISSLDPRQSGGINIELQIAAPPVVNNNDTLSLSAFIDSTGDLVPANNVSRLKQLVSGAFDPNDKIENRGGTLLASELSGELNYTIRFQNTGNDTAFNVVIKDTLDAKLDWSSIQMVSASHSYQLSITDGNILTWTFADILLPDSNRNEPGSHGYVIYRITPKQTLAVNDVINNSASIYFDFNLPVKTNTHQTVVKASILAQPDVSGVASSYCSTQGVQKGKINNLPASGSGITVTVKLNGNNLAIAADSTFSFDVSALAAGAHVVEVTYTNGTDTKTSTNNFNVTAAVSPDVNVGANITTVANLVDPVVITATNAAGGGSSPLYTFGKDRGFTNLWQAEGSSNTLNLTGANLQSGDNWIYVRMKTSATCYTTQFNIDSIKIALQIPVPNQPVITGLKATYCSNEGAQKAKLTNYPAAGTGTTVTVKLDGAPITLAMADTSFSFNLTAGNHTIEVTYTNSAGTRTTTANFTVTAAATPDFDISGFNPAVSPITIGINNITGGGNAPTFTFALDRNFTNILQAEGTSATITISPSVLKLGENKLYVRMKTSASCYTQQTAIDSVTITKFGTSGIVDPDYPNQRITANPNPFRSRLMVHGLSTAKVYTLSIRNQQGRKVFERRIPNLSSATIYLPALPAGIYSLSIYDETKNKLLGTINIAKQ